MLAMSGSAPALASPIFTIFSERVDMPEPEELKERLAASHDAMPIILQAALEKSCELASKTLDLFTKILGAAVGNLGLNVLATGGVFLGGGIPPRILPALESETFLNAIQSKGRMSKLVSRMPVHVILNPEAALLGAAHHGLELRI